MKRQLGRTAEKPAAKAKHMTFQNGISDRIAWTGCVLEQ
jgi:hypothetical protein